MLQASAFFFSSISILLLACQPGQDSLHLVEREKQAYMSSSAAKWYSPNLLKKVDTLVERAKQGIQAGAIARGDTLIQQARWLVPDPNAHLPEHVSKVLGSLKFKHDGAICSVLYSPDGTTLITASQDGTVRHWDLSSGRTTAIWDIGRPLGAMAMSPDEKWLAVAEGYRLSPGFDASNMNIENEHTIYVYERATGERRWKLTGHGKNPVLCLAFSPDSKRLASGCHIGLGKNEGIKIWNLETGAGEESPLVSYSVGAIAWSKNGERLFAAQDNNSLAVINLKNGHTERSLPREADKIYTLALSPDGETLAVAGEMQQSEKYVIRFYSTKTWTASNLPAHRSAIVVLVYGSDGKTLISASAKPEAAVRIWNVATKMQMALYQGHRDDVTALAVRPDAKQIVTASLDQSTQLWRVLNAAPSRIVARHQGPVWGAVVGADRQILTFSADQSAVIWNLEGQGFNPGIELTPKVRYLEHHAPVTAGAYRPDYEEVATGGGDQVIRLWNPNTGQTNATLTGHTGVITALCYSPDGKRLYSSSSDRTVRAWDLAAKKVIYTLPQHRSVVTCVALNLDGSLLASGGADNVVRLWNAANGKEIKALIGHTAAVTALSFSPGGQLIASVGADGRLIFWDAQSGNNLRPGSEQVGQVMALAFSSNSKYLATGGADELVHIWNVATNEETHLLQGHTDWVTSAAFLRDNEALVTASVDGTVRIWEQNEPAQIPTYGHEQAVHALAMSTHGDRLASGSDDGQIILWDPLTGNDVQTLSGHSGGIISLAFSADGKLLLSGDREQKIRLWNIETGREIQTLSAGSNALLRVGFVGNDRGIDVGLGNGEVVLWRFSEKEPRLLIPDPAWRFIGSDQSISAYSIQQTTVALGTKDGNATIWHVPENLKPESRQQLQCYAEAVQDLVIHADGKRLLTVNGESSYKWWDVEQKKVLTNWIGRQTKPIKLALHPKSQLALVSFQSNELVLFDTAAGKELRTWKFRGPITDVVFSSETKYAFAASKNGAIYQLDLPQH
jgi:WD40 repeat protein